MSYQTQFWLVGSCKNVLYLDHRVAFDFSECQDVEQAVDKVVRRLTQAARVEGIILF